MWVLHIFCNFALTLIFNHHLILLGDILSKKWRNLRDNYSKYLRSTKTTTGQGVNDVANKNLVKYKKWQWAPQMEFLKPFIKTAR